MRRFVILVACLALLSATAVQASFIPLDSTVVNAANKYVSGAFPINTIGYARTPAFTGDNTTAYDLIEIHLINYLSGTTWLSSAEGSWTGVPFDGLAQPSMYFAGVAGSATFKGNTKNQGGAGPNPPQTWVNFDSIVSGAVMWNTRTGTSPLYTVVGGSWFTTDNTLFLRPTDVTPPSSPELDDGNDETLIAKIYVQAGGGVRYNGKFNAYNPTTHGNTTLTGVFNIPGVPEPSTLVLLATGLMGLLAYAWRKRR
jgi:hypothetical protein